MVAMRTHYNHPRIIGRASITSASFALSTHVACHITNARLKTYNFNVAQDALKSAKHALKSNASPPQLGAEQITCAKHTTKFEARTVAETKADESVP